MSALEAKFKVVFGKVNLTLLIVQCIDIDLFLSGSSIHLAQAALPSVIQQLVYIYLGHNFSSENILKHYLVS